MNKMVIFDLDGTLLDTLDDLCNSVNYSLRTNNFPERSLAEVRTFVGNGIRLLIERSVPEGTSKELIDKTFECFKTYYAVHCNDKTKTYPGVMDMLKELKKNGYKIAVLSNKAQYAVTKLCNIYFNNLLDDAVGARENVAKKPSPDALYICAENNNINLNNVIYVGDSDVDVATANNAGVRGIAVTWGFRSRELLIKCGAENLADNTDELLQILLK
jgi:phosphoglycolate phosphatase|uniref:HAD family hydrolase n=1 Tax=Lachnospira sp. TaxID=2049031 RepID=UPI003FF1514D